MGLVKNKVFSCSSLCIFLVVRLHKMYDTFYLKIWDPQFKNHWFTQFYFIGFQSFYI